MENQPILAITMGDPAGIGPEITVKALLNPDIRALCRPIIIGDKAVMEQAAQIVGMPQADIRSIQQVEDTVFDGNILPVLDLHNVPLDELEHGKVSAMAGAAAYEYVAKAISLALEGRVDGTVTNPLNKEALNMAGHHYSGHTEIYADLTGIKDYSMMLAEGDLRVVHVSTHVSLREACDRVKKERVHKVIRIAHEACHNIGIPQPRIAVAGLNPHSGENGLFGREEIDEIIPAIRKAQEEGLDVDGPVPPDTVFSKALGGLYDIVVAMYHDQGHIPLKVTGFVYDRERGMWKAVNGVNITLGLPIIRSSVDHGTAFDQAGKGIANASSLCSAIRYAAQLANQKQK